MEDNYSEYKAAERERSKAERGLINASLEAIQSKQITRLALMSPEERSLVPVDLLFSTLTDLENFRDTFYSLISVNGINFEGYKRVEHIISAYGLKNVVAVEREISDIKKYLGIVDEA